MMPHFSTVSEAIANIGTHSPDQGFTFQNLRGDEVFFSFIELEQHTAKRAAAIQEMGLGQGDRVGLIIIEPEDFILTFLACLRIGVIPVPLYPPLSFGALDAYVERTSKVLSSSRAKLLLVSSRLQNVLWNLVDQVDSLETLLAAEKLKNAVGTPTYPNITPESIAFLQYTSGSTADPKGVIVTHGSLIANTEVTVREGLQLTLEKNDKCVSWLPLYHDMGLIGFVIAPLVHGISTIFIPTLRFIKRPSVWLDTMHRHRATVSFAPNFAFALATRRVKDADLDRWDLSCVQMLGCGAEPIQPETVRAFTELFSKRCNMPTNAVLPAYGMAEATLCISLKRRLDTMRTIHLCADTFGEKGEVVESESEDAIEHVSCGRPFKGHEVVAMSSDGTILPEGREGELCVSGPSVTPGYFQNPTATAETFRNGWLHTGDLGYMFDGEVYVTGRIKDLIIVNGRNIHPQAVEWAVAEVENVRRGNVVAFSVPSPTGEALVVVLESKLDETTELARAAAKAVQSELSLNVSDVIVLKPGSIPKTSSGKLQRRKTRTRYIEGSLGGQGGARALGGQGSRITLAKHVARSVWSRAKSVTRR
jgi:acyl-CoA synthetase (AMP-forming)/AMP-acid ligase II